VNGSAERPLVFASGVESLLGMLHPTDSVTDTGVLIIVGGPQYRVGSHRQFLLLARRLAASGIPALRFDYRGMGDSGGGISSFEHIAPDIAAAVEAFIEACPGLSRVVLWGLCDAASAALFYAPTDPRVAGLVLLNPWVRTEQGLARAYVKHYYLQRLLSRDFWSKLYTGGWKPRESIGSFLSMLSAWRGGAAPGDDTGDDLPGRMASALAAFGGPVLFILSLHNDLVADEFRGAVAQSPRFQRLMSAPRVTTRELEGANHTFSSQAWRGAVEKWTQEWVAQHLTAGKR
jgi:exosortase A-associated hydrolase 1